MEDGSATLIGADAGTLISILGSGLAIEAHVIFDPDGITELLVIRAAGLGAAASVEGAVGALEASFDAVDDDVPFVLVPLFHGDVDDGIIGSMLADDTESNEGTAFVVSSQCVIDSVTFSPKKAQIRQPLTLMLVLLKTLLQYCSNFAMHCPH